MMTSSYLLAFGAVAAAAAMGCDRSWAGPAGEAAGDPAPGSLPRPGSAWPGDAGTAGAANGATPGAEGAGSSTDDDAGHRGRANPSKLVRRWLEVKLPPPPRPGVPHAKASFSLHDGMVPSEYAGMRLWVGGAAPRTVAIGRQAALVVAASDKDPLRMEIEGLRVLAFVRPGDSFFVQEGHDGGWWAGVANRMTENAPSRLTLCNSLHLECPAGYLWTPQFRGDPGCKVPPGETSSSKCVKAPVVRIRGPLSGRAEDVEGSTPLTAGPLAANEFGPWSPVTIGRELMPLVRLGTAEALLVMGPGEACQLWLDDQGRIDGEAVEPP